MIGLRSCRYRRSKTVPSSRRVGASETGLPLVGEAEEARARQGDDLPRVIELEEPEADEEVPNSPHRSDLPGTSLGFDWPESSDQCGSRVPVSPTSRYSIAG